MKAKRIFKVGIAVVSVICLLFSTALVSVSATDASPILTGDVFPLEAEMLSTENGITLSSLSPTNSRFLVEETYTENRDNIDFSLLLRLKEEFQSVCSSFKVEFGTGTPEQIAANHTAAYNEELAFTNLVLDEQYQIQVTLTPVEEGACPYTYYLARILCGVDVDGTLVVDLSFTVDRTSVTTTGIQPRAIGVNAQRYLEDTTVSDTTFTNDNGTEAKAVSMIPGCTYRGYIEGVYDHDYFKFVAPCTGYADVMLLTPGMQYLLWMKSASGTSYGDANAVSGIPIFLRVPIEKDTTYYVAVRDFDDGYTHTYQYTLNVNVVGAKTWYSQMHGGKDGAYYWNTYQLDLLYFNSTSERPFMVDAITKSSATDYMIEGCFIASSAMVLRNMDAKFSGTDFRTGYTGDLTADPYTVMLANIVKTGGEITTSGMRRVLNIGSTNPVYVYRDRIAAAFGKSCTAVTLSGTNAQKATSIANALTSHPEGVIVLLNTGHYVVIGGDNGGTNYDSRFIVYDAGTAYSSYGNGVPLSARGYSLSNVTRMYYFS